MKQKLLNLVTTLLLMVVGTMLSDVTAQTTVNIVNGTTNETTNGSWSGLTWTSNASSGLAGLTMTFSDGAHDRFSTLNGRYNLSYHPAAANTNATLTLTAPVGYLITGYSVETGVYQAQTYTLTTADATPITPANLGDTYTPLSVSNLATSSTAITITTTNASKWLALANFSVTLKPVSFKLNCVRGYLKGNGTALSGTDNAAEASEFVIVPHRGHTYLYDATNKAFVNRNATESKLDCTNAISSIIWGNTEKATYPFYLEEGTTNNWLNMDGGKNVYINNWKTLDDGNRYNVTIVDTDFDTSWALTVLEASYHSNVKIVNALTGETSYGSWDDDTSKTTWTSDASSGLAGLTLAKNSGGSFNLFSSRNGRYNLAYYTAGTETLVLTAPEGYVITGYFSEVANQGAAGTYTLTAENGTSVTTESQDTYTNLEVTGLSTSSTQITVAASGADGWLLFANFTVMLRLNPFSTYYGEKWVRILGAGNTNIAMGISSATNGEAVKQKTKANEDNGQLWCLVGDANSFKMYNKLSGTTLQLASNSTALQPSNGAGTAMRNPGTTGTDWKIVDKLDASNPGWGICYAGSDGSKSLNAWLAYADGNNINYYAANDGNSHWVFEPATLPEDPSGLEKNSVYALYCAYTGEGEEYPLYNNDGVPNVSDNKATTPQMFVLSESGKILSGAYLYNLQKAEGDGYLSMGNAASNRQSLFSTTDKGDYLFLNSASTLPDGASDAGTRVDPPYFHFYGWYASGGKNFYPAYRGPYRDRYIVDAKNDAGGNNVFGTTSTNARTAGTNNYNYRWKLVKQPYSVYYLVVRDASGNILDNVQVSYKNSNDADIQRAPQANGGIFVIKDDVTPTAAMFKSADGLYEPDVSINDNVITVKMTPISMPSAVTTIVEGRYVIQNRGRDNKYLTQSGDVISGSPTLQNGSIWHVVPADITGQYFIRNESDGRYIQWVEAPSTNFNLVESAANATRVIFSNTVGTDVVQSGCVAIKNPNGATERKHFHMDSSDRLVRWEYSDASDWYFYPVEYAPEEDVEFLIQNTRSGKYATYGGADNAQLVQNAKSYVDGTGSVWTLTTSDSGYKLANGGTGNLLASHDSFTAEGVTWYIQPSPYNTAYYSISTNADPMQYSCLNDAAKTKVTTYYGDDEGSCWRFIPVDVYYLNALAYLDCLYDANHGDDMFYISDDTYNTLTASVTTSADKVAKANAMYNVLNDYANFNMPEDGKDYLIRSGNPDNNRYVYTVEDGTKLYANDSFNSSFFWNVEKESDGKYFIRQSCYGTTGGQYPEATARYIDYTQPASGASPNKWLYTGSKPGTPLNFDIYLGEGCTSIYTEDTSHRMNVNNYDVITWKNKDNGSKWQFIPVEEASVGLLTMAQAAIDNGNHGAFTLTEDSISVITAAKTALENTPNYQNYYTLEQLLNDHRCYYWLESGRYLVRNYEYDPDGEATAAINDTETYLTSMLNPVGAVKEAINYWSIWDITNLGSGQYTMVNEGHLHILAPGRQLDGDPLTNERNQGHLFYDTSSNAFHVGDSEAGDEATLLFYPAVSIDADVTGSYAAISVASQISQGKYLNMWTKNDHIASYSCTIEEHSGKGFFWEFIPLSSANLEGDPAWSEADMFKRKVDALEGYVGGVVTLDNVSTVPCLQDIADLRDATVTALKNGTVLNYTNAPYEAVTINEIDSVGAKAYRAILDRIHDIKDGKVGESGTTDASIKKYYQDLRPTEMGPDESLGTGDDITHPFFLENMSGQRPEFGARLTEKSDDGSWHSATQATVTGNEGVFYVTRESGDAGQSNATYSLKNGNNKWLQHGDSTKTYKPILQTVTEGERMKFYIDPVIPGVWQIRDTQTSGAVSDTQTLVTTSSDGVLRYYFGSEISSLWKFKTFNEIDTIFIKKAPAVTQISDKGMHYFCTFSYPIDFRYPKTGNPVPYYCSAAYRKSDGNLKLVFNEVPTSDADYYILEGNTGYLFMLPTNANEGGYNYDGKNIYIPNAQMISGGVPDGCKPDKNLMLPNLNKKIITAENYRDIYALAYKAVGDPIGSYYGTPAFGVGMGFYHIRIGGWLNPNTAYIHRGSFVDDDSQFPSSSEVHESVMPAEITLEDGEGNIVDKIEVLPDGTWQSMSANDGPVYDLTGRRVEKPTRGIYIQNGRKVMFK